MSGRSTSPASASDTRWSIAAATEHVLRPGCDFSDECDFGLDPILYGFEQRARR